MFLNNFFTSKSTSALRNQLYAWQGQAIVEQAIAPNGQGRVRFRGTYWPAQCVDAINLAPGVIVEVIDRHNLTLMVKTVSRLIKSSSQNP